jgi:hypothetical protein
VSTINDLNLRNRIIFNTKNIDSKIEILTDDLIDSQIVVMNEKSTTRQILTAGLIETATSGNNNALISVTLDGTRLDFNHDQKYRIVTDPFIINLPEHNIWEEKEKPGKYIGVAEGYFLMLKPLAVGNHTLYYEAGIGEPNPNQYAQSVTYHLNLK